MPSQIHGHVIVMAIGSPSTSVTANLVYGSGANPDALSDGISGGSGVQVSSDAEADDTTHDGRSMYVTLFEGKSTITT